MDARYGGRTSRKKMILNDFYDEHEENIYVFGGSYLSYRVRLLGKQIEKLYHHHTPTVIFYNAPYKSQKEKELREMIFYLKNKLHDHNQQILFIDQQHPYYHPLLGIDESYIVKVIDHDHLLLKDDSAYLDALLTLIKASHHPVKLHSLLEYMNYDLSMLIQQCDLLLDQTKDYRLQNDLETAKKMFEEEQVTHLSTATLRKLLKSLNFGIVDIQHPYCHYSLSTAIENNQIICINLAGKTEAMMTYFESELATIAKDYHAILFDVNCSLNKDFELQMLNIDHLSIYSENFNRDFSNENQSAVLGKNNVTLLFKMQSGTASPIVNYYGQHNYTYKLVNQGRSHTAFDFLHIRDNRYRGYQQHQERVNKLSSENVADLREPFECFEIDGSDIIYHNNVSYEGLL